MSSKVLWCHHFEPHWDESLRKYGTSFCEVQNEIISHLTKNNYDRVVVTMFEGSYPNQYFYPNLSGAHLEHSEFIEFLDANSIEVEFIEYGYGWYRDSELSEDSDISYPLSGMDIDWILGQRDYHDGEKDILSIEGFQKDFKSNNDEVHLCGAFNGECLCDAESILEHLNINYEKIEHLCVG
jgi:hypothetical protein